MDQSQHRLAFRGGRRDRDGEILMRGLSLHTVLWVEPAVVQDDAQAVGGVAAAA